MCSMHRFGIHHGKVPHNVGLVGKTHAKRVQKGGLGVCARGRWEAGRPFEHTALRSPAADHPHSLGHAK